LCHRSSPRRHDVPRRQGAGVRRFHPVHVHDLNATILHLLGFDHTRLTYRFQGRDFRLTDVHGEIVRGILA
jgi:hypothetical protein